MTAWIELGSFIVVIALLAFFLVVSTVLAIKIKKLQGMLLQAEIDRRHALEKLSEARTQIESKNLEQTDGFVRFISESRDWAFSYIEDVQNTIVAVKNDWDNNNQMEESIQKLFTFLPENKEK